VLDEEIKDIEPNESVEFKVKPVAAGLPPGTYPVGIAVSGEGLSASQSMAFAVGPNAIIDLNDIPGDDPGGAYTWTAPVYTIQNNTAVKVIGTATDRCIVAGSDVISSYIILEDVDIQLAIDNTPFKLNSFANVNLILKGTNVLKATTGDNPGLNVPDSTFLTIAGEGTGSSIEGCGSGEAAGIGGGYQQGGGNITIKSGKVTGSSGTGWGAGIGGGRGAAGGTLVVEDGEVYGYATYFAAGIGGVYAGSPGYFTIRGGTVTARGDQRGYGIGAAENASHGIINIEGGTLLVSCGNWGSVSALGPSGPSITLPSRPYSWWYRTSVYGTPTTPGGGGFSNNSAYKVLKFVVNP
jgi:hypothetical protein